MPRDVLKAIRVCFAMYLQKKKKEETDVFAFVVHCQINKEPIECIDFSTVFDAPELFIVASVVPFELIVAQPNKYTAQPKQSHDSSSSN